MIGVEFVRDAATREPDGALPDQLIAACADAGLLVLTCGASHEVIRWIPPLNVTAAEIAEGVEIFGETLATIPRGLSSPEPQAERPRIGGPKIASASG